MYEFHPEFAERERLSGGIVLRFQLSSKHRGTSTTIDTVSLPADGRALILYTPPNEGHLPELGYQDRHSASPGVYNCEVKGPDLDEFVHKLGFFEEDQESGCQSEMAKVFLRKDLLFRELFALCIQLYQLNHPTLRNGAEDLEFSVSMSESDIQSQLADYKDILKSWHEDIAELRQRYPKLLLFSMRTLSLISMAMDSRQFSKVSQLMSVLFENSKTTMALVENAIARVHGSLSPTSTETTISSLEAVGGLVDALIDDEKLKQKSLLDQVMSPAITKRAHCGHVVHLADGFTSEQLLRLVVHIYNGLPESFEFFWCNSTTSALELDLFLPRASSFHGRMFVLVEVNAMTTELQEQVYRYQQTNTTAEAMSIHYIVTKRLALQEAPWVNVRSYKEDDLISQRQAKEICNKAVAQRCGLETVELVYGGAGDGKSHYIRKNLKQSSTVCTIAIHEAFSEAKVIEKLKKDNASCLFFNVTLFPAHAPGEDTYHEYHDVLMKFNWFLFKLFGLGFVHDEISGNSLRIRSCCKWRVYVEVPSLQGDDSGEQSVDLFQRAAPFVSYVSTRKQILPDCSFDVDEDAQFVCKWLKAYDTGSINRTYKEKRVSDDLVSSQECNALLLKYMPNGRKITQHLFVQYMNRRCRALKSCPDIQFNPGCAIRGIDTTQLASTIMRIMLKEALRYCAPNAFTDVCQKQLVYDSRGGSTSFLLFCLNPMELEDLDYQELSKLGVKIPTEEELNERCTLDDYLSKGLNVDLTAKEPSETDDNDKQHSPKAHESFDNDDDNKQTSKQTSPNLIDNAGYVLTADFAMKMLAVHERLLCGTSVILEGDTGVGKTRLLQMLADLWKKSIEKSRQLARDRIVERLHRKTKGARIDGTEVAAAVERISVSVGNGCNPPPSQDDVKTVCSVFHNHVCQVLLHPVTVPFDNQAPYFVPLNPEGANPWDSVEGSTELLSAILSDSTWESFNKCYIHAGLTPGDIVQFLEPLIKLANRMAAQATKLGKAVLPRVVVFLDEINTSSCPGLLKEVLFDRTLDGNEIPQNVHLVAACNPNYKPFQSHSQSERLSQGVYRVRRLPPSIRLLLWDFGAMTQQQERAYVTEKLRMLAATKVEVEDLIKKDLICLAQETMRKLVKSQLERDLITDKEALRRAVSFVSQRDIQRVFDLAAFLQRLYEKDGVSRIDEIRLARSSVFSMRSTLVSLGIVYYLRLDVLSRKHFAEAIDRMMAGTTATGFERMLELEIRSFVKQLKIPRRVAITKALAENLFAIVVCTAIRLPVVLVGPPGCSKTLSFKVALAILRGDINRTGMLQDTDLFPYLDLYHYQCSRHSTSNDIDRVFKRATTHQHQHIQIGWRYTSVVFMDEVGLPSGKDDPLKALHQHLDQQHVAFVGITNRELDPSKANRAVNVLRLETDDEDLRTLALACLCSTMEKSNENAESFVLTVNRLCPAYAKVMMNSEFKNFFGLRDFIHFVHYIRRNSDMTTKVMPNVIVRALERNFNGVEKAQFRTVLEIFLTALAVVPSSGQESQRGVIAILSESLQDQSLADSFDSDSVEAEVRFKLLIDTGEDDSVLDLLFATGVLDEVTTCVFTCSDFSGDSEAQKINLISDIRHAALEGKTVVLSMTEDVNESFYDLFNQSFKCVDCAEQGRLFFTSIAIGSHSKLCRVHPRFQCIVHVRSSGLGKPEIPSPLLNRFEKFRVGQEDILELLLDQPQLNGIKAIIVKALEEVRQFETAFGREALYGASPDTVTSIFLDLLLPGQRAGKYPDDPSTSSPATLASDQDEDDDDIDENEMEDEWRKVAPCVISNLETVLRRVLLFHFRDRDSNEQTLQAQVIFGAVSQLLDDFDLRNCKSVLSKNPAAIQTWLLDAEALLSSTEKHEGETELLRNTTFVVATVVQWLVFHCSDRLLQLAVPEALIARQRYLPQHFFTQYFEQQTHFSLEGLLENAQASSFNGQSSEIVGNAKLVCFTKTTSFIHRLPSKFPADNVSAAEEIDIKRLLPKKDLSSLSLLKLDRVKSFDELTSFLHAFISRESECICLLLANMEICSAQRINNVRWLIKKLETTTGQCSKHFVLILHFPPSLGRGNPCYPAHFLRSWDHFYLDSIVKASGKRTVNVCHWIKATIQGKGEKDIEWFHDSLEASLVESLPSQLYVVVSRVEFDDGTHCQFNKKMDARSRVQKLKDIFERTPGLLNAMCRKFARSWRLDYIRKQLQTVAVGVLEKETYLSVQDRLHSKFLSSFHNFLAVFLVEINEGCNLDVLCPLQDEALATLTPLFVKIVELLPTPRLEEVLTYDHTFHSSGKANKPPLFPFFDRVSKTVDYMLGGIIGDFCNTPSQGKSFKFPINTDGEQQSNAEDIGSDLLSILSSTDEAEDEIEIARAAWRAVCESESLWNRYFEDFVNASFGVPFSYAGSHYCQPLDLLLGNLSKYDLRHRFVHVHTAVRLNPLFNLNLGNWLSSLNGLEAVDHPQLNSNTFLSEVQSLDYLELLQGYAIRVLYNILKSISCEMEGKESTILQWCNVYKSMVRSVSLHETSTSHSNIQC